jgi:anaerobic selenocysteine-containing dehydrogenase
MSIGAAGVSRRTFVKGLAAAGAVAAIGMHAKPLLRGLTQASGPLTVGNGEWRPTTCQGCTSWCSKQVYVTEGRAIKVRGNANSKVNGMPQSTFGSTTSL